MCLGFGCPFWNPKLTLGDPWSPKVSTKYPKSYPKVAPKPLKWIWGHLGSARKPIVVLPVYLAPIFCLSCVFPWLWIQKSSQKWNISVSCPWASKWHMFVRGHPNVATVGSRRGLGCQTAFQMVPQGARTRSKIKSSGCQSCGKPLCMYPSGANPNGTFHMLVHALVHMISLCTCALDIHISINMCMFCPSTSPGKTKALRLPA